MSRSQPNGCIRHKGLKRVMVIDWDLHHGNGTQDIFYDSAEVLYTSTHQFPHYPGTGSLQEVGAGEGLGYTVNAPMPAEYGDSEYLRIFDELIIPIGRAFKPQFILVSAGFDCHWRDPLGEMQVTENGFAQMMRRIKRLAAECCDGKIVAALEGGYNLEAMANSGAAVIDEMGREADEHRRRRRAASACCRSSSARARASGNIGTSDAIRCTMTPEIKLIGRGDLSAREHRLGASQTSVGSDPENDLVIAHPTVSRKHAILRYRVGGCTIEDLESSNGTFVNGRRIRGRLNLKPGDEVSFGAAKFAVTGGVDVARRIRRRSLSRIIGAIAGLVLFAIAGFLGARHALDAARVARQSAEASRAENVAATKPAIPSRETTVPEAEPSLAPAPVPEVSDNFSPVWLKHLNDFRNVTGLLPVQSDPKLSAGDRRHAVYMIKNFATEIATNGLGAEVHTEDPAKPWYTPEGAEAARTSDITERGTSGGGRLPSPEEWAIEGWMTAPFHRLLILNPRLHEVGFGYDCEDNICVALLNVLSGADPLPSTDAPFEHPIVFPTDGSSLPASMRQLDAEWPTPISGCDGYAFPTGLPVTLQLGPLVDAQLSSFSIASDDGATIDACGFDASSYRNADESERERVAGNLRGQGAIVIVPRSPLDSGTRYDVLATVNGHDYKWSFEIAR